MAFSLACIVLGNDLLQKELQEKEGFQYSDVLYLLHSKDKVGLWHPSERSPRGNGSKKTQSVTTKHSPRQHTSIFFKRIYFVGHEFVIIWFQIFHSCHVFLDVHSFNVWWNLCPESNPSRQCMPFQSPIMLFLPREHEGFGNVTWWRQPSQGS